MTDTFAPGIVPDAALDMPASTFPAIVITDTRPRARRKATPKATVSEATPRRRRPRTGSGATRSADNILLHWFANIGLVLAVAAGGVGSIDGLLAAAEIAFKPEFHWVLPTALDVFLVGTAVATLALRERRAWGAAAFCVLVSLGLVGFSAVVNFIYWQSVTDVGSLAHEVGPFIKGAMPVLLLIALEILAAINTTKRKVTPASVVRLRSEVAKVRGEMKWRAKLGALKAKKAAKG